MATFRVDKNTHDLVSLIELSSEMYLKFQEAGLDTRPIEVEVDGEIYRLFQEGRDNDEKKKKLFEMLYNAEKRYLDAAVKQKMPKYDA